MLRDERFLRENFKNIYTSLSTIVTKSAKYIPNLGIFCPQPGNVSFPTWEQFTPLMGTLRNKKNRFYLFVSELMFIFATDSGRNPDPMH